MADAAAVRLISAPAMPHVTSRKFPYLRSNALAASPLSILQTLIRDDLIEPFGDIGNQM